MGALKSSFKSLQGIVYNVSIYSPNVLENTTVHLAPDPVHLRYDRGDIKYTPKKSILCDIRVVTDMDLSVLYSDSPLSNAVEITRASDGKIIFTGYLIPSQWRSDARPGLKTVVLNAVDAIGMLKYRELTNYDRYISTIKDAWWDVFNDIGGFEEDEAINDAPSMDKVNIDSLLPTDHTESQVTGNWPTMETLLDAINKYTNTTTMIWGGVPINANIDTYTNAYFPMDSPEVANMVRDDNVSLEIVPAYSRIEYTPGGGERVTINNIIGNIDADKVELATRHDHFDEDSKTTYAFVWASTYQQSAIKDIQVENVSTNYGTRSNILLYRSYGEKETNGLSKTAYTPVIFDKLTLRNFARHPTFSGQTLVIRALIYISESAPYPTLWSPGLCENNVVNESTDTVTNSHIVLKYFNLTVYPSYVDIREYNQDQPGFYNVVYRFDNLPQGLVSPSINLQDDHVFVKELQVLGNNDVYSLFDSNYSVVDQLDSGFKNPLNIEMPFMPGVGFDYAAHVEYENSPLPTIRQRIRTQYQHPRRLFTCALPFDGFHPFKKVRWKGYKCTIDAADIDLRNDKVTVQILESGL